MNTQLEIERQPRIDSRRRRVLAAGAGLATAMGLPAAKAQSRDYGIEGQSAPEIELDYWIDKNGDPTEFSVTANRGKWVFLKCFQNWCPGCHASGFPTLQQFAGAFHDHPRVAIAGIQTVFEGFNSNTKRDVRKLQQRYELPITMGHDPGNREDPLGDHRSQTMKLYRTGGTPWLIVIDPAGTVVYNHFNVNVTRLIEHIEQDVA
jgi:thiol-disulfide isomerase/thioredoxin